MFFLSDEEPSFETLDNYSHISAVLKPLWLFHFDFHTAYAALHFYFMVLCFKKTRLWSLGSIAFHLKEAAYRC